MHILETPLKPQNVHMTVYHMQILETPSSLLGLLVKGAYKIGQLCHGLTNFEIRV